MLKYKFGWFFKTMTKVVHKNVSQAFKMLSFKESSEKIRF